MNIAISINNLKTGGAESLVYLLAKTWIKAGHNVFMILHQQKEPEYDFSKLALSSKTVVGNGIKAVFHIIKYFRDNKIDVCYSHLEHANKITSLAGYISHVPVYCVMHSINIYIHKSLKEIISSFIYNHFSSGMIAISSTVKEYMLEMGIKSSKIFLIENGIDVEDYEKRFQYQPNDTLGLLFIGRIERVKGIDFLMRALAKFNQYGKEWELTLVGDGSERSNLEQLSKELGIDKKIVWAGRSTDPWSFLQNSSCLCLTSLREGLPMTILEGLSIGLPMIVSRVGYLPELVDEENGYLCEPGNEEDIFQKLLFFSQKTIEEKYTMSNISRQRAKSYSIKVCSEKYLKLI